MPKYGILCLTTGDYIRLNSINIFSYCDPWVKNEANIHKILANARDVNSLQPMILLFNTKETADWFVRRRLSFNPARKASNKLIAMQEVFNTNYLSTLSTKVEFEIMELSDEEQKLLGG